MENPFQALRASIAARFTPRVAARSEPARLREDGLLSGTQISTLEGWRPVETIEPGDVVVTFDNALQKVTQVHRVTIDTERLPQDKRFVLDVPATVLGNRADLTMLPAQEVLLETDLAESLYGDPFTLVPMHMLEGMRGISRRALDLPVPLFMLTFAQEQLVLAEGMTLALCRCERDFSPFDAALRTPQYHRLPAAAQAEIAAAWAEETGRPQQRRQPAGTTYATFSPARM